MPNLQLVVDPNQPASEAVSELGPLACWFDSLAPLSALAGSGAAALLRDLAFALSDLLTGKSARAVIPTEATSPLSGVRARKGAVWEIGVERDGDQLLVSLFKQGVEPDIAQVARQLDLDDARRALLTTVARFPASDRGLALAREALIAAGDHGHRSRQRAQRAPISVTSPARSKLTICATTAVRVPARATLSEVARADLHSLLFRGPMTFIVGSCQKTIEDGHLFLVAEQLAWLVREALHKQRQHQPMLRGVTVAGVSWGIQLDARGRTSLLIGDASDANAWRMPPLPCIDVAKAIVGFGRRLCKQVVEIDRTQRDNLRLSAFRRALRELSEQLRGGALAEPKLNLAPESYRAFAESGPPPAVAPVSTPGKLRFSQSWRADVPSLDLRSLFLAHNRLIVGSPREIACIERSAGHLLWTRQTHRAVSIMTPVGVARLGADGLMSLHDVADGEPMFEIQLGPCVGASTSGAVVSAPGLPNMLLVAEGARHLVAVDLDSNQVRWRRVVRGRSRDAARRPLRMRRAGKLMVVCAGEATLMALDLLTGEVVWRHTAKRRYSAVSVDRGDVFAFSSEVHGRPSRATLSCFDPYSGDKRWSQSLPRPVATFGSPLASGDAVAIICRDDDRQGLRTGVMVFDRTTGALRFDMRGTLCDGHGGCLVVDDMLLANSESGELVAVSLVDGAICYRHVFAGWSSRFHPADRPRSVQPILRSGALFLPQSEVYVVQPHDGTLLGRLPGDLIPDALHVDERCGVYIAEASGYIAAYHALPTLTLVRPL